MNEKRKPRYNPDGTFKPLRNMPAGEPIIVYPDHIKPQVVRRGQMTRFVGIQSYVTITDEKGVRRVFSGNTAARKTGYGAEEKTAWRSNDFGTWKNRQS